MKDENYIHIQGWMVNKLNLSGNDLICYAIIYGFSQDEQSKFNGSTGYLSKCMNCSKPTVFKSLKSLIAKNYLVKTDIFNNGVKFCQYSTNFIGGKESLSGVVKNLNGGNKESLWGGGKESLYNNTINNNTNNNTIIKKEERFNFRKELLDFGFNETLINDWLDIRKKKKGSNSKSAFNIFVNRVKKSKYKPNQILETMVYKSWTSFEEDWIDNLQPKQNVKKSQDELLREKFSKMPSQLGL